MKTAMRWLWAPVAFAACTGGLQVEKGNAYPCDFTQPEGVRDAVCSPGDVCGVDNRCRQYQFEGPQFEGDPRLPTFSTADALHPGLSRSPVVAVAAHFGVSPDRLVSVQGAAAPYEVTRLTKGFVIAATDAAPLTQAPLTVAQVREASVAIFEGVGPATVLRGLSDATPLPEGGPPVADGRALRAGDAHVLVLRWSATDGPRLLELSAGTPVTGTPIDLSAAQPDGGSVTVVDARYVPGPVGRDEALVLSPQGFYLGSRVGPALSWRELASASSGDFASLAQPAVQRPKEVSLRHDVSGAVWAYTRPDGLDPRPAVLSTWTLGRAPVVLAKAFNDCTPCRAGHIVATAPLIDPLPAVEVLCAGAAETLSLVKVVGAVGADPNQECLTERLEAPFLLSEVARGAAAAGLDRPVVRDESRGGGVALGGAHGQLWVGAAFSSALPLFLERVPQSAGALALPDGGAVLAALTDRYPAAALVPGLGFQAFDVSRSAKALLPSGVTPRALSGQAQGYLVMSSGDLVRFSTGFDAGVIEAQVGFGPRLSTARGDPSREPFFLEGVRAVAGKTLVSFVATADDSVYLVPAFEPSPAVAATTVTPQLTPEPGSPIRSFALDRSAIGTDGVTRVRAYAVTSRNVYAVTLDGAPPRWSATSLPLSGGEPLEVWMDHPLGGLGRVGYRDGQIFTLPGGFLLAGPLPQVDGGEPTRVLDFDNLGGWPVAMTSTGLYAAEFDLLETGRLDMRFADGGPGKAMHWVEVALPDGGRPWLGKPAQLQVVSDSAVPNPDGGRSTQGFSLLVYLPGQVLRVGRMVRECSTCL